MPNEGAEGQICTIVMHVPSSYVRVGGELQYGTGVRIDACIFFSFSSPSRKLVLVLTCNSPVHFRYTNQYGWENLRFCLIFGDKTPTYVVHTTILHGSRIGATLHLVYASANGMLTFERTYLVALSEWTCLRMAPCIASFVSRRRATCQ